MRKIISVIFSVFLLGGIWSANYNSPFNNYNIQESYNISNSSNNLKITKFSKFNLRYSGESFCIDIDNFNLQDFIHTYNAKIVYIENLEMGENIYLISDDIKFIKRVGDNDVNIQIFIDSEKVTVGTPIIFGSF